MKQLFILIFTFFLFKALMAEELKGKLVREVEIKISDNYFVKHIKHFFHKANTPFCPERLNRSIKLLFSTGRFQDITVTHSINKDKTINLIYNITPVLRVNRVFIRGHKALSSWTLNETIMINVGDVFDKNLIKKSKEKIIKLYKENGFYQVNISYSFIKVHNNRINIVIDIKENEPLLIDKVVFPGAQEFSPKLLKRLHIKPGSRLIQPLLQEDLLKIKDFFEENYYFLARIHSPIISTKNEVVLTWNIELKEKAEIIFRPDNNFELNLFKDKSFDKNDLFNNLNLKQYTHIDEDTLKSIKNNTFSFFHKKGYINTKVRYIEKINTVYKRKMYIFYVKLNNYYTFNVTFLNNKQVNDKTLNSIMINSSAKLQSNIFNENDLIESLSSITTFYKTLGFLSSNISKAPTIHYNHKRKHVHVTIEIDEGSKTTINEINFTGVPEGDHKTLLDVIKLKNGFNPISINVAISLIEDHYKNQGYFYAKVNSENIVNFLNNNTLVNLNFNILLGPIVRVEEIILNGNYISHDRILTREIGSYYLTLKKGDIYTPQIAKETQEKLSSTGVFQSVSIIPIFHKNNPEKVDLLIKVIEKDPGLFKLGMGYKNDRGLRAYGSILNNNLGGMNRTLYLKGELNQYIESNDPLLKTRKYDTEFSTETGFVEPWLFNSRDRLLQNLTLSGNLLIERRDNKLYQIDLRRQITVSIEKELSKYGDLTFSYKYDRESGFNKAQSIPFSDNLSMSTANIILDHRDSTFNTQNGAFNKLTIDYASPKLYSNHHFVKAQTTSNIYFKLFKTSVFAASIRLGTSKTFSYNESGEKKLPITLRYFLGGRASVRGYDLYELGPKKNNTPLGGEHFSNYKCEIRIPFTNNFGTLFFLDGGNVYSKGYSTAIRHSWGAGLRYQTPIGPISLEYGIKINPDKNEPRSAVHFSIGTF